MLDDNSPVPIAATYAPGSRNGTVTFDRDLDQTQPMDLSTLTVRSGNTKRGFQSATYAGGAVLSFVAKFTGSSDVGPDGITYSASPAWIKTTDGGVVASFVDFPYP